MTRDEVQHLMGKLKTSKPLGPNSIHPIAPREMKHETVDLLTQICHLSLKTELEDWRVANVTQFFAKSGEKQGITG